MHKSYRALIGSTLAFLNLSSCAAAAQSAADARADLIDAISHKYQEAKQYAFEGDLDISRRGGSEKPREQLFKGTVKLVAAPSGKYLLRIEKTSTPPYILMSDGQKSWAYVPSLKKYTEREASTSAVRDDPAAGLDLQSGDLAEQFCHLVVPILAGLAKTAGVTDLRGSLLTILAKKDESGHQNMTYLTLDTTARDVKRITWMNATPTDNGDKVLVRTDLTFASLRIGGSMSDEEFTFHPPREAKRVDSLPGIAGTGRPAR